MTKKMSSNQGIWTQYSFFESKTSKLQKGVSLYVNCTGTFQGRIVLGHENGKVTFIVDEKNIKSYELAEDPIIAVRAAKNAPIFYVVSMSRETSKLLIQSFRLSGQQSTGEDIIDEIGSTEYQLNEGEKLNFFTVDDDGLFCAFTPDKSNIVILEINQKKEILEFSTISISDTITGLFATIGADLKPVIFVVCESSISAILHPKPSKYQLKQITPEFCAKEGLSALAAPGIIVICNDISSGNENINSIINFIDVSGVCTNGNLRPFTIDDVPQKISWFMNCLVGFFKKKKTSIIKIFDPLLRCIIGKGNIDKADFIEAEWGSIVFLEDLSLTPKEGCTVIKYDPNDAIHKEPLCETACFTTFTEKGNEEKIKFFTSQFNFDKALLVCKKNHMPEEVEADIERLHGDMRLERYQDVEGAVDHYIKANKFLEPSYVTTRLLSPQYADQLLRYLEALHEHGAEKKQHTTLRFNCYTKMRKTKEIERICNQYVKEATNSAEPTFDVDAAISVLSSGGYIENAIDLSRAYHRYDTFISLLDKENKVNEIFDCLKTLACGDAERIIKIYGQKIIESDVLTKEFIEFCAHACAEGLKTTYEPNKNEYGKINPEHIFSLFITRADYENAFYKSIIAKDDSVLTEKLWNRAISVCLAEEPDNIGYIIMRKSAKYNTEYAQLELSLAIQPLKNKIQVYNDYQVSLQKAQAKQEAEMQKPEDKRKKVTMPVKPDWFDSFDIEQYNKKLDALYQSQCVISEKRGCYKEIIALTKPSQLKEACQKYQNNDPDIWREATQIAIASGEPEVSKDFLNTVLETGTMRLNEVLPLFKLKQGTYDLIADFTLNEFQRLTDEITRKTKLLKENERKVEKDHEAAVKLREEIYTTKKSTNELTEPAIFFKCGHYYNINEMGEEKEVCLKCRRKFEEIASNKLKRLEEYDTQAEVLPSMANVSDGIGLIEKVLESGIMDAGIDEKEARDFCQKLIDE